jgi:hypothetical protein
VRAARNTVAAFAATLLIAPSALAQAPERIPASVGMQASYSFRISNRLIPGNVGEARFRRLVSDSARRWGMRGLGRTSRVAGARDRMNTVGFDRALPSGTLAIQQDFIVRVYRRVRSSSGRRPRTVYVGERVVERDITVDPRITWNPGPAHPAADQYDLETVLIHELGHMAGNKPHVPPCTNSPMWEALDYGEWWRSPSDWYGKTCGQAPPPPDAGAAPAMRIAGAASRRASAELRFGHRRTVVGRVVMRG